MSPILEKTKNPGRNNIRGLLGSFEINGPDGRHVVLVMQPAQMSLRDFKSVFRKDGFDEAFVQGAVQELLKALDFIRNEAQLVHTGLYSYDAAYFLRLTIRRYSSRQSPSGFG
jgi:hypothetical protein